MIEKNKTDPPSQKYDIFIEIFGAEAVFILNLLFRVLDNLDNYSYEFISQEKYHELMNYKIEEAMEVYWLEILNRSHFSALTSLLRIRRWIEGINWGYKSNNAFVFFASFRSLLESLSDSNDALANVSFELAENRSFLEVLFSGHRMDRLIFHQSLEDTLIHFTHARKLSKEENVPETHKAKSARDYLKAIESDQDDKISDCYTELCNYAHPSGWSIMRFADFFKSEQGTVYSLNFQPDQALIREFIVEYSTTFLSILALGILPSLAILKILNMLPVKSLHTRVVDQIDLDGLPAWEEVKGIFLSNKSIEVDSCSSPKIKKITKRGRRRGTR